MSEEIKYKCKIEECDVTTSGKCAEGYEDIKECPNCSIEPIENNEVVNEDELESTILYLHSGEDLDSEEILSLTRKALTIIIVLAGAVGSGKTTLIKTIYEMFQKSSFAGYFFAGSKTLIGFERRCHLSRITSNRVKPETDRTIRGHDSKFLHLRVRKDNLKVDSQDLLFSDISGETFNLVRDSDEECKNMKIIKRADHFGLIIDGEKISKINKRQKAFLNTKTIFRRCIENNMIGKNSFVQIIFSKYDLLIDNIEEHETFISNIKEHFIKEYEEKVLKIDFFNVAAQPLSGSSVPLGFGLDNIFPLWIEKSHYPKENYTENYNNSLLHEREFVKFLGKHFMESKI